MENSDLSLSDVSLQSCHLIVITFVPQLLIGSLEQVDLQISSPFQFMRFAREKDSTEIYELYKKNRKIFPNITMGHITNRIKKRECIYTEGVVIIFRIHQKTVQIGDNTQSKMSDCVLNQIVTSFLNGSASRVLNRFLITSDLCLMLLVLSISV